MLLKDSKKELLKRCMEIDRIIKRNINLIPINNWQFDDETIERLREQKHRVVDEHLTDEQKQKLSKASKQRLAREIGVNYRTITDVLDWMTKHGGNTRPVEPNVVEEVKKSKNMRRNKKVLSSSEVSNTDSLIISSTEISNEGPLNGFVNVNGNGKKIRRKRDNTGNDKGSCASFAVSSAVAPFDVLEGRKLALKRLQEKLEQFKAKRQGKMTAYQYEEKRKLKRRMSKLKMKERKTIVKQQIKNSNPPVDEAVPNKRLKLEADVKSKEMQEKNNGLIFSKFDFIVRDKKRKETKKDKRDKFVGKDYKRLLEKAEHREERLEQIRSKNPEKAMKIEKNIKWKRAVSRAEGQKVKDNPELLKKSLKKKEKIKEWRKKKWANRVEHTLQMQTRRQEKRSANIQARKDTVKKRKMQKARKKGRVL